MDEESKCLACGLTMDVFGDHALQCAKNGSLIKRHNAIVQVLSNFAIESGFKVTNELGSGVGTSAERCGDVIIHDYSSGGDLFIDAMVGNMGSKRVLRSCKGLESLELATFNEKEKLTKYREILHMINFTPFTMETVGGLGKMGLRLLRSLIALHSIKKGISYAITTSRIFTKLSIELQSKNGMMLLEKLGSGTINF